MAGAVSDQAQARVFVFAVIDEADGRVRPPKPPRVRRLVARSRRYAPLARILLASCDAGVLRASELQRAVQHANGHSGRRTPVGLGTQRVPHHPLEEGGVRIHQRLAAVPRRFLPACAAAALGVGLRMAVPLRRGRSGRRTRHRARTRWSGDRRVGVARHSRGADLIAAVGAATTRPVLAPLPEMELASRAPRVALIVETE